MRNYVPKCVPIKLADNKTVPIVNGQAVRPLEFSRVLHVPDLRNNLFSVLFLTRHKGFTVSIDSTKMSFQQPAGNTLFTGTISDSDAAFLDGTTVPLAEYASAATTLPLDLDLWHTRLAHHHFEGVKKLLKKKLVTGMTLNSSAAPDPICEPCLAGKMHANPFLLR